MFTRLHVIHSAIKVEIKTLLSRINLLKPMLLIVGCLSQNTLCAGCLESNGISNRLVMPLKTNRFQ